MDKKCLIHHADIIYAAMSIGRIMKKKKTPIQITMEIKYTHIN